jgi:hypothetical protein
MVKNHRPSADRTEIAFSEEEEARRSGSQFLAATRLRLISDR